ncbi:phage tail protein [Aeromonas media]|uniref:phage tail-collar fiber domain-containing protein n=1 Tax=Aeromonas media TaxID=651 RepID=UPI003D1C64CD
MSAIYFAIPTNAGQARIANAIALGIPLKITHMAIGDGNGQPVTPNPAQTSLAREVRRAPLNTLFQDPLNPAQLVAEQVIPEDAGGWWVREVGLYDDSGTLIAVANTPESYKPILTSGAGRTQTIRMVLIVSDTSAVEVKIDPSVVLATRKYVDDKTAALGFQLDKITGGLSYVSAESYSGANDTAILQAAVNDAITKKILFVTFNRDYNVTGTIPNRQEVIFLGCHKITGPGSYRMRIVRGDEQSMPILDGISAKQLPKFSSKSSPVVVVVGDSISTYQPNTLDRVSSQYSCIIDKIKRDNPDKTPIFYNRAIGGQMFKDLDTVPTGFVDWYTNQSTPWLDYVSALDPDLVIVSMGMNDGSSISLSALNSVVNKIKAFPTNPDLIMVTPAVPSTNGGGAYDGSYGSKSAQEGRDIAAGFIRSLCAKKKIPCLDVNRVFNVMRDGFDILDSYNVRLIGAASTNGAFISPVECRNWSARFSLPNRAAYNIDGNPLSLKVGVGNNDAVFIGVHTDNTLKLTCYNSAGSQVVLVPSQIIPDTPHKLQVEVYNQKVRVYVSTTETDKFPDWVNLHLGSGLYYPAIGGYNGGYTAGGLTSLDDFNYGEHVRYMPSLTNSQMWGVGDGTANTHLPYGGNGVNHLTTMGIAIFTTALEACDFSMADGSFITAHPWDGGYETKNGRIVRIWGTIRPAELTEQIDKHITWPVTITTGKLAFIASWGVLQADLTQVNRGAQTILTCGLPDYEGVDITFHNLNLPLAGRYAAWELNITY